MKKIFTLMLCAALLFACLSGCYDENTARTSGITDTLASSSDILSVSETDIDYSGYVIPAEEGLEYSPWEACEGSYVRFAEEKLLDMAGKVSSLCMYEETLKVYRTPEAMLENAGFRRLVNDLRAWSFGAASYPSETLGSENEREICRTLSELGQECADFAEHLPSFVLCQNEEAMAECENTVLGMIAQLKALLEK